MWAGAAALLLAPAAAMQLTGEVDWTAFDFAFAAVLLLGGGGLVELAMRASLSLAWRAGAIVAIGAALLTIVVNGAVGMIGSEDDPYNLWFLGVVALAIAGGFAARFRAQGMAIAMAVVAAAQAVVSIGGMASDPRGGLFSAGFSLLWLAAAAAFHMAAREARRR
jgi:hypothetical protein